MAVLLGMRDGWRRILVQRWKYETSETNNSMSAKCVFVIKVTCCSFCTITQVLVYLSRF